MNKMGTVLVLPSWYPSRIDKFTGDFIQRHVHAISLCQKQYVLYVVKDMNAHRRGEVKVRVQDNLTEKIIYYHPLCTGLNFIDRLISHRSYIKQMKNAVKEFIAAEGMPELVHVHVSMKAGIIALWIKQFYNISYMVSEHWTGFLPESRENVNLANSWFKKSLSAILKNAFCVTAVSQYLSYAIQAYQPVVHPVLIPNVVDTTIFYPIPNPEKSKVLIHASTMNYQKNTEAIVVAMTEVIASNREIKLHLYGPIPENIKLLIKSLHLEDVVIHKGEVSQQELATAMRSASGLILYSRYETFGCVIIEALACKLPVIVSDLPVFHEIAAVNKNGTFVELGNDKKLVEAIIKIIQFKPDSNNFDIAEYCYESVAQKFVEVYKMHSPSM